MCCTTGSPVSMATRTSNDKAEYRIRANLNAWGSGMEGLNDDSPALRKLQFNIHAPSAPPHVTQAERTSGPSMTRRKEAAAGAPSPHLSGSSAEVGRLSTARSSTSQHEDPERPPNPTLLQHPRRPKPPTTASRAGRRPAHRIRTAERPRLSEGALRIAG